MELSSAISLFSAMDKDAQLRLLARFGHNLTTAARDTFIPQTDGVHSPERLRMFSELQRRIFDHMHDLMATSEWRRPDETIVSIMLDHNDPKLKSQVAWALEEALGRGLPSNTALERTREK